MRTTLMLLFCAAPLTAQSTWYVDVNGTPPGTGTPSDPYTSIQYAITRPTTHFLDTLLVAPGTYVENIVATHTYLRIRSTHGPLNTTLRAATIGPVVTLDFFSVLDGFTVTGYIPGSSGPPHGAVHLLEAEILNCIVRDNAFRAVACVYPAIISRCTIVNNAPPGQPNQPSIQVLPFSGGAVINECITDGPLLDAGGATQTIANYTIANFGVTPPSPGEHGDTPASFGVGNLDVDPQLWDEDGGDMHLRPGSPAIDAGNPASPLDPDGSRRDIGAVPYDAAYAPPPLVYCTSQINSFGCSPAISSSGVASASSASPCFVTCSNQLNQRAGFLFYGYGPRAHPYQGGWLCVESPTRRTPPQNSGGNFGAPDCSGTFSFELNGLIQSGVDPALAVGTFLYSQYWSRDPAAPSTANRSDALRTAIAL